MHAAAMPASQGVPHRVVHECSLSPAEYWLLRDDVRYHTCARAHTKEEGQEEEERKRRAAL